VGHPTGVQKGNRAAASLTFSCGIGGREEREEKKDPLNRPSGK